MRLHPRPNLRPRLREVRNFGAGSDPEDWETREWLVVLTRREPWAIPWTAEGWVAQPPTPQTDALEGTHTDGVLRLRYRRELRERRAERVRRNAEREAEREMERRRQNPP